MGNVHPGSPRTFLSVLSSSNQHLWLKSRSKEVGIQIIMVLVSYANVSPLCSRVDVDRRQFMTAAHPRLGR